MKKIVRLTESELKNMIQKALREADTSNKMKDMVTSFNRYGRQLPNNIFKDNDPDKPEDWDIESSWKLSEPDIDNAGYYGDSPQSIQRTRNSHLAFKTGHPINYNGTQLDKLASDEQIFDPDKSSHDFTFDDDNTFIRPSHWMIGDDKYWGGINEPKVSKTDTFDSADKRQLHRKGSGNRELMGMNKKLDEAISRAIRKYLK